MHFFIYCTADSRYCIDSHWPIFISRQLSRRFSDIRYREQVFSLLFHFQLSDSRLRCHADTLPAPTAALLQAAFRKSAFLSHFRLAIFAFAFSHAFAIGSHYFH